MFVIMFVTKAIFILCIYQPFGIKVADTAAGQFENKIHKVTCMFFIRTWSDPLTTMSTQGALFYGFSLSSIKSAGLHATRLPAAGRWAIVLEVAQLHANV